MASKTLAVKYRPTTFDDVTEQGSIKVILQQQLNSDEVKNAYLFCGPAGCGKTTCARIFANEINKGQGNPIEMDAASNSGVDDVRNIIQQAQTKSLDSEYKVFIIDECHSISNTGWQAFLKLIEEPPAKSIFIFCTTDPQKIPRTILSRVQRYDFTKISQQGIVDRLQYIFLHENESSKDYYYDKQALEYIAKIADGGMRDAISLMDKALAYNIELTLENVVAALGTTDYDTMFKLANDVVEAPELAIELVESIYNSGKDLKQFVKQFVQFLIDVQKYAIMQKKAWQYVNIPKLKEYEQALQDMEDDGRFADLLYLLEDFVKLNSDIKYSNTPKYDVEAVILLFGGIGDDEEGSV